MQKIFILSEYDSDCHQVEKFIGNTGIIVSVTPNVVSTGSTAGRSGKWLVVADDKKGTVNL
jgi:hypothetical protein